MIQGKTARIWRAFGGERDHYRQKSRFRERKVARKPGMLTQTNLLKCMRSSWQFPFNPNPEPNPIPNLNPNPNPVRKCISTRTSFPIPVYMYVYID